MRFRLRWSRLTIVAGLRERILGISKRSKVDAILERLPTGLPEARLMPTVGSNLFCLQMSNSTAVNSSCQSYRGLPPSPFVDCRLVTAARHAAPIMPALWRKSAFGGIAVELSAVASANEPDFLQTPSISSRDHPTCGLAVLSVHAEGLDVRSGSQADIIHAPKDDRYSSESGLSKGLADGCQ